MAANQMGDCCFTGHLHSGTPKGKIEQFGEITAYISHPPAPSPSPKVVLILTDVFGLSPSMPNSQLLADAFSSAGYVSVVPDILLNDAVPYPLAAPGTPEFVRIFREGWIDRHRPELTEPVIEAALERIRREFTPEAIGVAGYCFGGKYVVRLLGKAEGQEGGEGLGRVKAGFMAHPAPLTMEELGAVKAPLAIAAAETDNSMTTELRHASEAKLKEIGATYQITLFSGVEHGFASRGDPEKRMDRYAMQAALAMAIGWFKEFL